jgi:hypothetical protein
MSMYLMILTVTRPRSMDWPHASLHMPRDGPRLGHASLLFARSALTSENKTKMPLHS